MIRLFLRTGMAHVENLIRIREEEIMQTTNEVKQDQYRQVAENTFIRILIPEYVPTANNMRKVLEEAPLDDSNLAKLCYSLMVDQSVIPLETPIAIILRQVENPEVNCVKNVHFVLHSEFLENCISHQKLNLIPGCFYPEPYQFSAIEFNSIPKIEGEIDEDYLARWIETVTESYASTVIYLPYAKDENINYVLMREEEMQLICHEKHSTFHPRL